MTKPPYRTQDLVTAIGYAVLTSILGPVGKLQVVGRAELDGWYVVGDDRLPACLIVGCASKGQWLPVPSTI